MAKIFNGAIELASAINQTGGQPLDDRVVVKSYSDLINPETFGTATYVGMCVSVVDEKKLYVLVNPDKDVTADKAWKAIGGTETVNATNHTDAVAKSNDLAVGQLIKVAEGENDYAAGFYIVNAPGNISLLATSTGNKDEVAALAGKVTALESTVGHKSTGDTDASTGLVLATEENKAKAQENAEAIKIINGGENQDGSIAKAVKDAKDALIGGASGAMDTFKEVEAKFGTVDKALTEKVVSVTGSNAIDVTKGTKSPVVSLKLAKGGEGGQVEGEAGNVKLSQTTDGLKAEVTVLSGSANGTIKIGKSQAAVTGLEDLAYVKKESLVTELNGKYDALNAASTVKKDLIGDAATEYNTLGKLEDKIIAEAGRADKAEKENKALIDTLNGDDTKLGSVAFAVKAEADRAKGVESDHETRIAANETAIAALSSATHFIGISESEITDGLEAVALHTDKFPASGDTHTPVEGDVVIYGSKEFIASGETLKWVELGDTSAEAGRIDDLETIVGKTAGEGLQKQVANITELLADEGTIGKAIKANASAISAETTARESADNAIKGRLDKIEGSIGESGAIGSDLAKAKTDISALQTKVDGEGTLSEQLAAQKTAIEGTKGEGAAPTDKTIEGAKKYAEEKATAAASGVETKLTELGNEVVKKIEIKGGAISTPLNGTASIDLDAYAKTTDVVAKEDGKSLVLDTEITKLSTVKKNAQENVIEKVTINGVEATGDTKAKTATINASNIQVGKTLSYSGESANDIDDQAVDSVLQDIYSKLREVNGAKVASVTVENDNDMTVGSDPTKPVIGLKKETSTDEMVALGHIELKSGTNGLYGLMYYGGDDVEK